MQKDHIDWGFRLSGLYGTDYRYTNSYGVASWQFNGKNLENGYDFPMEYVDIYIPYVLQGLEFRIGRYISIPDIEAQLAPNNLTYTHSLTYGLGQLHQHGHRNLAAGHEEPHGAGGPRRWHRNADLARR